MKPERWQQIKAVLAAALEHAPGERATFLEWACGGDTSLRAEVESLISYEQAEDGLTDSTAVHPGIGQVPALRDLLASHFETAGLEGPELLENVGRHIGPYKIVRELGRGGMGAVYLAERSDHQYHRKVAIKLIRLGMDTNFVLRRFLNERQILAAFDHRNVARLLDGGTTENGLPYLVMDYVEGLPIDHYCDRQMLNTEERLKLFRQVCAAVHYAHQRLVIHRDVKPSNILVTEEGVPKLLDFGIAKLLGPELAAQTLDQTATALRLMTPAYASPEQIKGEPITTATDIYSLGVLLYELLTGHKPYRIQGMATHELMQAVLEEEPIRPSLAISLIEEVQSSDGSSSVTLTPESVSKTRDGSPDRLRRRLRGDLDNIVFNALRKDPQRRYASVEQFSEDIRRHLEGLPVVARKETLSYRAAKFIRRNKISVAAAIMLLVMLIGGIVAVNQQRARAERRFNDVRKLARSVVFDYDDALANLSGSTPVRQRLVRDALEYLDSLATEAGDYPTLQRELAMAYRKIGDVQGNSNMANLGDTSGGLASYQKSLAIRQSLVRADQANREHKNELAESYERIGDILRTTGDVVEADENYRQAIALLESLSASAPEDRALRKRLGDLLYRVGNLKGYPRTSNLGDTSGAIEHHRKALAIRETLCAVDPAGADLRRDVVESHRSLANLLIAAADDLTGAEPHARQALAIAKELVAADPTNVRMLRALLVSQDSLARLYMRKGEMGEMDDALEICRQSLGTAKAILAADPTNMQARQDMAGAHMLAGNILMRMGDAASSLEHHRQSLSFNKAIAADDPNNMSASLWVAQDNITIGRALLQLGDLKGGLHKYYDAIAVLEATCRKIPGDAQAADLLGRAYYRLGEALIKSGDLTAALENFRKAEALAERILSQNSGHEALRRVLALSYFNIGEIHARLAEQAKTPAGLRTERWEEARAAYQRSLDLMLELRGKGVLPKENADKPDQITRKIAACDAALAR